MKYYYPHHTFATCCSIVVVAQEGLFGAGATSLPPGAPQAREPLAQAALKWGKGPLPPQPHTGAHANVGANGAEGEQRKDP